MSSENPRHSTRLNPGATRPASRDPDVNPPHSATPSDPSLPDHMTPTRSQANSDVPPNLADAINALAESARDKGPARARVREPEPFDGSDARKLHSFLVQCELNFQDRPKNFPQDSDRVNFAVSFLKGMALEWFEPAILGESVEEDWLEDWDLFLRELKTNFGPFDPTGDAEVEIDHLRMKDSHRVTKYNVEFNHLSARLHWDEAALRHNYYRGLLNRIKDEIARIGKPTSLPELRKLTHDIDRRYWERKGELAREAPPKGDNPQKSEKKSQNQGRSGQSGAQKNTKPNSGNNSGSLNQQKKSNHLKDKIGQDGKLTPEEHQWRFDNNLCLVCGGTRHVAKDCLKTTRNQKGKACVVNTSEPEVSAKVVKNS